MWNALIAALVLFNFSVLANDIVIEDPNRGYEIEDAMAERWESFFDKITDATNLADEERQEYVYDLDAAHRFVVADENLIDYSVVNGKLGTIGDQVAEESKYLKDVDLAIDTNIGGPQHKWIVENLGSGAAGWFPYTLNFDLGTQFEGFENNDLDIQSVELGFGAFQSVADPRTVTGLSYVNKVYFDFEVGLDSLEVFNRVLELDAVLMLCSKEGQESVGAGIPELQPVLAKACELAGVIKASEDFQKMLVATKPLFNELDALVDETIAKLLETQGDAISTLVKIATDVKVQAKTCERFSREWWMTPLPEWKDWAEFQFTGCVPSVRVDLGGGAVFAGGQSSLTISEDNLKLDVITTVNDRNLGAFTEEGLDESKAEALAYFWATMKTAETMTEEEIAYFSEFLSELLDDSIGYLVEDLDDDLKNELN